MISADEFLKWCEVFGIKRGGGGGSFLPLAGGSMTGNINMQNRAIIEAQIGYRYVELSGDADLSVLNSNVAFVYVDSPVDLADETGLAGFTDGFTFALKNVTNGNCTFTPKTGEFIDGQAVLTLAPQDGYIIVKNADQWSIVGTNVGTGGGVTASQVQHSDFNNGIDSGVADAYVVTLSPVPSSLTNGMVVTFTPLNNNTLGNPTVNIGFGGVLGIAGKDYAPLNADDLVDTIPANIQYNEADGSWQLLNPQTLSSVTPANIQNQAFTYVADTGVADAYVVDYSPAITALPDGMILGFTPANANLTNAPTININGITIGTIFNYGGNNLVAGDISANVDAIIYISAGSFYLLNPQVSLSVPVNSQQQKFTFSLDTGTPDNYVLPINVEVGAYQDSLRLQFVALNTNTGTSTVQVGALSQLSLITNDGVNLQAGMILQNGVYDIEYIGAANAFILLNPSIPIGALPLIGGTMQGAIDMGAFPLSNLIDPSNPQDAVTLNYLTTNYLALLGGTMLGNLDMGSNYIQNLLDPVNSQDAATKNFVEMVAAGFIVQPAVYAASTANLNATYSNGASGVGATLTNAGAMAAFSVDGVSPPINSRILYKDANTTFQNGIYTLTTVGSGAANWVLTRASDYDQASEINPGDFVLVNNGTQAGQAWLETVTVVTMGTSPILFSLFGSGIYALKGANNDISSMSGLSGYLKAPQGILDPNGNIVVQFGATPSSVNYPQILANVTGAPPVFAAVGADNDVGLGFQIKGSEAYHFFANSAVATNLRLYELDTNGSSSIGLQAPALLTSDRQIFLPDSDVNCWVAQRVRSQVSTVATGTTVIPADNTKPQITEGNQYLSLAITPLSASNKLRIDVVFEGTHTALNSTLCVALFRDSGTDAISCGYATISGAGGNIMNISFDAEVPANSTALTTFTVRAGSQSSGTTTFNGSGGSQLYGGVSASSISIIEYTN